MNMKFVKRIFAVSMAATILVVPVVAGAATKPAAQIAAEEAAAKAEAEHEEYVQEIEEKTTSSSTAAINGTTVQSNVAGTVDVTNSDSINAFVLNSSGDKTPGDKQVVYSKTAAESPAAFASAEGAATAIGGTIVGDALNADINLQNGGDAEIIIKDLPEGNVKIIQVGDNGETKVLDATVKGEATTTTTVDGVTKSAKGTAITFAPSNGHYTYFVVVL